MLTQIKFALLTGVFALSVTACGGDDAEGGSDASKGLVAEATTAMNKCKAKKGQMGRANCVSPALIEAKRKFGELVLAGDMTIDDSKAAYAKLEALGTKITGK